MAEKLVVEDDAKSVVKIGQYILKETLGEGAFGKVKIGEHQLSKRKVAIKILNKNQIGAQDVLDRVEKEVQILKKLHHPNVIKLHQVIHSPSDIFLVMEYVSGGELYDYIIKRGKLKEAEARWFFQQLISGVDYCHSLMIVHRDLKPENLLLDKNSQIKIVDFGLSTISKEGELLKSSCGSPSYAAPEIIHGEEYNGPKVDVWSCGAILYVSLCGKAPFGDMYSPHFFKNVSTGKFRIPKHLKNKSVVSMLHMMLQVDPVSRASIEDVKTHEWFQKDLPAHLFSSPV